VAIGLLAAAPEGRGIVTIQPESRRPPVGAVVGANLAKGRALGQVSEGERRHG
jgi:hypothetical protein